MQAVGDISSTSPHSHEGIIMDKKSTCVQIISDFAKAIFAGVAIGVKVGGLSALFVATPYAALIGLSGFIVVELITALYHLRITQENLPLNSRPFSLKKDSPQAVATVISPAVPPLLPTLAAAPPSTSYTAAGTEIIDPDTIAALASAPAQPAVTSPRNSSTIAGVTSSPETDMKKLIEDTAKHEKKLKTEAEAQKKALESEIAKQEKQLQMDTLKEEINALRKLLSAGKKLVNSLRTQISTANHTTPPKNTDELKKQMQTEKDKLLEIRFQIMQKRDELRKLEQ